jgi:hypothetical protein
MFTYFMAQTAPGGLDLTSPLWDIREEAYHMAVISYCAMFDPNATYRTQCKASLSSFIPKWQAWQAADGSWQQFFGQLTSWAPSATSVTLSNNSSMVTGNGTAWVRDTFPARILFLPGTGKPANLLAEEQTYYKVTYLDSTHLVLDRPYEGKTGTHGWIISGASSILGWGAQPFIEGILGMAFEFAAQALQDTDPATASIAHNYNASLTNWQRTYGFRPAVGGMQYFAGSVDCMPPISESSVWCTKGNNASQSRTLNAETLRSVMMGYGSSGDPALAAFGDTLYNAMFAKPGTCPPGSTLCTPDGNYVADLNDAWGWYMYGIPPIGEAHKWFGMFFGIGAGSDWPAYRSGGRQNKPRRPVRLGFNMGDVPGATAVRITATAPSGETLQTTCSSSPCTVEIDSQQGDHLFRMEYLSPTGSVLSSTVMPAVQGR